MIDIEIVEDNHIIDDRLDDIEQKRLNIILQSVLFNWDTIKSDSDFENILNPDKNSLIGKLRAIDVEQSDKLIKAKCVAFSFYLVYRMSNMI